MVDQMKFSNIFISITKSQQIFITLFSLLLLLNIAKWIQDQANKKK